MLEKQLVEIVEFTDPVCTWCWGSEPVLRRLETHYPDQVKLSFVMGGLVKDIRAFYDRAHDIGGDAEHSNRQVASHWLEASARHGMPVQSEGFRLFSDEYPSTYPQNIAYKAAQMQDQLLADRFLRRIREASAAEARQTNRTEVLIELAAEVGLDIPLFIQRFSDGSAASAFETDLETTARFGAHGFPTFLVRYGEKGVLLRGYQSFETFQAVINSLTGGAVKEVKPEKSVEKILEFISAHGRVAPVEIQSAFDLTEPEYSKLLSALQEQALLQLTPAGNGLFIQLAGSPLSCDPVTGVCYR